MGGTVKFGDVPTELIRLNSASRKLIHLCIEVEVVVKSFVWNAQINQL